MALSDTQLIALKAEITDDPKNLGYADQGHPEVAALLNAVGLVTNPNETIDINTIDGQELSAVVIISEYKALEASEQRDGRQFYQQEVVRSMLVIQTLERR